jgi:hypothetical protein
LIDKDARRARDMYFNNAFGDRASSDQQLAPAQKPPR